MYPLGAEIRTRGHLSITSLPRTLIAMSVGKHEIPPELERYLALCERAFERMVREGTWPWLDSPDFDDVVESEDIKIDNKNSI